MSAWVCSKAHIDAMVTKAIALGGDLSGDPYAYIYMPKADGEGYEKIDLSPANADRVGQMLADIIVTGVSHRYPGDDVSKGELPGPTDNWYLKPYKWAKTRELWDGETVALIGCYEYQASEHNDWTNTFGWKFCEHVKHKLLKRVERAWEKQNGKTEWGYEDEHVFSGFDKWAVVMRAVEFRPHCGGPLVLVPARNAEEAMAKANAWYDGEAVAAAIHPAELAPEEIEAETKRNAEWVAEQAVEEAPEIPTGMTPYAVWLQGGGVPVVRLLAESGIAACLEAEEVYSGKATAWIEHIAPLDSETEQDPPADATLVIRRVKPKALDPEVDKLLEELDALGEPGETPTIRNNR